LDYIRKLSCFLLSTSGNPLPSLNCDYSFSLSRSPLCAASTAIVKLKKGQKGNCTAQNKNQISPLSGVEPSRTQNSPSSEPER
jgi:hypothetical protein